MPTLVHAVQVAKTVPTGLSTPPSTPPRGTASSPGRGTPSRSPQAVTLLPQLQSQLARTLHSLSLANARVLALTIRVAGLEEERAAMLHAASDEFVRGGSRVFDALLFVRGGSWVFVALQFVRVGHGLLLGPSGWAWHLYPRAA